ncbi:hypothetical protein K504DRAFT_501968 [Pleomassaria siparia CBS 279.74]|uniref:Uncharacterized protein n=1 Tax=Pleomassaria siparia CBS 279.74 TaxID=1314801 RepID=A0A6G1K8X6_9PLEO|nr:hypothetical protein K504DRAFT_501968 [Pleomassaria siparia CBS 279.74]
MEHELSKMQQHVYEHASVAIVAANDAVSGEGFLGPSAETETETQSKDAPPFSITLHLGHWIMISGPFPLSRNLEDDERLEWRGTTGNYMKSDFSKDFNRLHGIASLSAKFEAALRPDHIHAAGLWTKPRDSYRDFLYPLLRWTSSVVAVGVMVVGNILAAPALTNILLLVGAGKTNKSAFSGPSLHPIRDVEL